MTSQNKLTKEVQTAKMAEMYREYQNWKSHLQLVHDELTFIEHLLNSYVFEPNTPNLFERLQDYQARIKKTRANREVVCKMILGHERNIGGMIECTDNACDNFYNQKHEKLKAETVSFMEDFKILKSEIFEYAGGILKKRKPNAL